MNNFPNLSFMVAFLYMLGKISFEEGDKIINALSNNKVPKYWNQIVLDIEEILGRKIEP